MGSGNEVQATGLYRLPALYLHNVYYATTRAGRSLGRRVENPLNIEV